jgi:hypothetical protein
MDRLELADRIGQSHIALAATPNQTMGALNIGRAKLYELINTGELESYLEGDGARQRRKILWNSIFTYIERHLAAEAARRAGATSPPKP